MNLSETLKSAVIIISSVGGVVTLGIQFFKARSVSQEIKRLELQIQIDKDNQIRSLQQQLKDCYGIISEGYNDNNRRN